MYTIESRVKMYACNSPINRSSAINGMGTRKPARATNKATIKCPDIMFPNNRIDNANVLETSLIRCKGSSNGFGLK